MNVSIFKHKSRPLSAIALLLALALLVGCGAGVTPPAETGAPATQESEAPIVGMHQLNILEKGPIYMEIGDTVTLTTDAPEALRDQLIWSSSAPCVGITGKGVLTAQVTGQTLVTVEYHSFHDSVVVYVVEELTETDFDTPHDPVPPATDSPETAPPATPPAETEAPEPTTDPYVGVNKTAFYANYTPATSNGDAYYRTLHGLMSGSIAPQDQHPTLAENRPMEDGLYVRNTYGRYSPDGKTYYVVDANGEEVNRIYRDGAYVTLEEVAAYIFAFGTVPPNYQSGKKGSPSTSPWGKYLRLNHSYFSGNTNKYPYEPELPYISGCGGYLDYYEVDIGTTGTTCDPGYYATDYNNGSRITRGAARIVYTRYDANGNNVIDINEKFLFYTNNHYNDFREYLNYEGGWGELFGNITGGGTLSSKYDYNPTPYVPTLRADFTTGDQWNGRATLTAAAPVASSVTFLRLPQYHTTPLWRRDFALPTAA